MIAITSYKKTISGIISLIAGALLTLAFAPFNVFPFALLCPAMLLLLWLPASPRSAFNYGFLFGFGFFTTGVSWVYISIHQFGNAPVSLSLLITALFISILSLFPAIQGYVLNRYFPHHSFTKILCAFPALWVFLEWIRSWVASGFPWLFLGDSQLHTPLKYYAPIFSVYGVSLATLLSSALVASVWLAFKKKQTKSIYLLLLGFIAIWIMGWGLSFIAFTKPEGAPLKVSLVQGNIPQELKWTHDHVTPTLNLYQQLTEQHWDSNVIVWPEAAIPLTLQDAENYIVLMNEQALKHHTTIVTGIFIKTPTDQYYNALITLGQGKGIYIKQRLVPFGEFTPFKHYLGKFLDFLDIPMSDVSAVNHNPNPITIKQIKIASFLCYEIAFPEQVLQQDGSAGIILTATDDAWFGRSIAQAQHLAMAQMRSLEMSRPGLFVGNNGITAFITAQGMIQSKAPPFEVAVLTDTVQPLQGTTPWERYGMDPILFILILMLVIGRLRSK